MESYPLIEVHQSNRLVPLIIDLTDLFNSSRSTHKSKQVLFLQRELVFWDYFPYVRQSNYEAPWKNQLGVKCRKTDFTSHFNCIGYTVTKILPNLQVVFVLENTPRTMLLLLFETADKWFIKQQSWVGRKIRRLHIGERYDSEYRTDYCHN